MPVTIPDTCEENAILQTKILLDILYEQRAIALLVGAVQNPSPYVSL